MLTTDFLHTLNLADLAGLHSEVEAADSALLRLAQVSPVPDAPMPLPPAADRVTRLEHAYNRLATIVNQLKRKLDELEQGSDSTESPAQVPVDLAGFPQVEMVPGNVPELNVAV